MTILLEEVIAKLNQLKARSFIPSARKGNTGIGHTLEQEIGLKENNLAIPDIGNDIELKAKRKNATSMITLFTSDRKVWKQKQKRIIETYGYLDEKNRQSFYSTVSCQQENSLGLKIEVDSTNARFNLLHSSGVLLGSWDIAKTVAIFISKLRRTLLVLADSRSNSTINKEEFWFNEAYLLENPTNTTFLDAILDSKIVIDTRMHLRPDGSARNHGTAFRISERYLTDLYADKTKIL